MILVERDKFFIALGMLDSLNFKLSGKISVACIDLKIIFDAF